MNIKILLAFHLLGVVLWMGGLLTLTRVLGYHARELPSVRPRLSWIEGRLDTLVAMPGALIVAGTGLAQLILEGRAYWSAALWLHWKLGLVGVVAVLHFVTSRRRRALAQGPATGKVPRALFAAVHGTIGLLLIAILVLAMVKRPMAQ